ncbi:KR domain-containing protein [Streptomyces sp. Mo3]|uniref:KR domain-containing protein n=1 Tax=Streptomyces sp. Mo3 TaxID=3161190 RepID=UPI0039EF76BE
MSRRVARTRRAHRDLAARLEGLGARVRIAAVDVTDGVGGGRARWRGSRPTHPLTGVIHAAGLLDDAVMTSQTPGTGWPGCGRPRPRRAAHLHTATADLPLSACSRCSHRPPGSWAARVRPDYAAANAVCRRPRRTTGGRRGLPGLAVAWGLWAQSSEMTGHAGPAQT